MPLCSACEQYQPVTVGATKPCSLNMLSNLKVNAHLTNVNLEVAKRLPKLRKRLHSGCLNQLRSQERKPKATLSPKNVNRMETSRFTEHLITLTNITDLDEQMR